MGVRRQKISWVGHLPGLIHTSKNEEQKWGISSKKSLCSSFILVWTRLQWAPGASNRGPKDCQTACLALADDACTGFAIDNSTGDAAPATGTVMEEHCAGILDTPRFLS